MILSASDRAASAGFGGTVSVFSDTVLVGASDADSGGITDPGQAYIFRIAESGPQVLPDSSSESTVSTDRAGSYMATSRGAPAGGTMTFVINEPVTANAPGGILSVAIVPSTALGETSIVVRGAGPLDRSPFAGQNVAGIVSIELVAVNPSSIST